MIRILDKGNTPVTIDSCINPDIHAASPSNEGDYSGACEIGRQEGADLITRMQQEQNPTLLGAAIRKMVERRQFGPVEIGFCSIVALALIE